MSAKPPSLTEADIETRRLSDLVDEFASRMKAKLWRKYAEGYTGWNEITEEYCLIMIDHHLEKGDPIDIANFAAFLWHIEGRK